MIPRYEQKEITKIWSDQNRFETFLKIELSLLESLEKAKKIPKKTSEQIRSEVNINPLRVTEIEKTVHHDVIAFCTSVTEQLPQEVGRFFHFGVTSSDILDTCMTLQIRESLDLIIPAVEKLCQTLKEQSIKYKDLLTIGRSHGMHAEPMSFGLKFLSAYSEFSRRLDDLKMFYQTELTGQISGAVGNYTIIDTEIEKETLSKLKLNVEPVSTQVIPRDRVAKLVSIHALLGSAIERISTEIRLLHHSDIGELHEGFSKGQKGSSIMPHKKNPISGENLCGIARILKSHIYTALENITLWHERDISHSSAERLYLPDNLSLVLYAIQRLDSTIENLVLHEDKIESKVTENFNYLSSYYLHFFIANSDLSRESLYEIMQHASFSSQSIDQFKEAIRQKAQEKGIDISKLPNPTMKQIHTIFTKSTDAVYKRTFKN